MSEGRSVEEIAAEFMERRQAGEDLDVEAFLAEHPEHAEELRGIIELMTEMEKFDPDKTMQLAPEDAARINLPDPDYKLVRELGVGANIQHYNPVIDEAVRTLFGLPENYVLVAQMPFGGIVAPPAPKADDGAAIALALAAAMKRRG